MHTVYVVTEPFLVIHFDFTSLYRYSKDLYFFPATVDLTQGKERCIALDVSNAITCAGPAKLEL